MLEIGKQGVLPKKMMDETKTAPQIAFAIKEQAVLSLGPWPRDLELFIFGAKGGWRIGLSPAAQGSDITYREGVMEIARELQKTIQLAR